MVSRKKKRLSRLRYYSSKIEKNLPISEIWFRDLWESRGLKHPEDKYNEPWERYIPDLVNHFFKYVIEVDGSFHLKQSQIKKDLKKDNFYKKMNYQFFRIKSFQDSDFNKVCLKILAIRTKKTLPSEAKKSRVILRKQENIWKK